MFKARKFPDTREILKRENQALAAASSGVIDDWNWGWAPKDETYIQAYYFKKPSESQLLPYQEMLQTAAIWAGLDPTNIVRYTFDGEPTHRLDVPTSNKEARVTIPRSYGTNPAFLATLRDESDSFLAMRVVEQNSPELAIRSRVLVAGNLAL